MFELSIGNLQVYLWVSTILLLLCGLLFQIMSHEYLNEDERRYNLVKTGIVVLFVLTATSAFVATYTTSIITLWVIMLLSLIFKSYMTYKNKQLPKESTKNHIIVYMIRNIVVKLSYIYYIMNLTAVSL